jgi:3-oxoadipate enol-lactonase
MYEKSGRLAVAGGELQFDSAGQGEPVVFLHGFSLDLRSWAPQFEALASSFRVIRYDLRGFGRSSLPPQEAYSHEDDLNTLLSHLGATPAHVVGLSMGGRMALRFTSAYPQSVRSLVLADSALDGQGWTADWQTRWTRMCSAAKTGDLAEARRQWSEHPLFDSARAHLSPASSALLATMIQDYSGWHWHNKDLARVPSPPLAQRLGEICVPSLLITGADDIEDFQAAANLLGAGLPNVQRVVIPNAGHMSNLEAPEDFNAALRTFWRDVSEHRAGLKR